MNFNEEQVISEISSIFSPLNQKNPRVIVGIGDDAAVVATDKHSVITTDMAIEDVHFNREWSTAYEIGSKITVANLADVYAIPRAISFIHCISSILGSCINSDRQ